MFLKKERISKEGIRMYGLKPPNSSCTALLRSQSGRKSWQSLVEVE